MQVTLLKLVTRDGDNHGDNGSENVRWSCQKQSFYTLKLEGFHESRDKGCDGTGRCLEDDDEGEQPHLIVRESRDNALDNRAALFILASAVNAQAMHCDSSFFRSQPLGGCWEVRQNKHGAEGKGDGDTAFDDEKPLPGMQAMETVHTILNTCTDKPAKCTRQESASVHHGSAGSQLTRSIPC